MFYHTSWSIIGCNNHSTTYLMPIQDYHLLYYQQCNIISRLKLAEVWGLTNNHECRCFNIIILTLENKMSYNTSWVIIGCNINSITYCMPKITNLCSLHSHLLFLVAVMFKAQWTIMDGARFPHHFIFLLVYSNVLLYLLSCQMLYKPPYKHYFTIRLAILWISTRVSSCWV